MCLSRGAILHYFKCFLSLVVILVRECKIAKYIVHYFPMVCMLFQNLSSLLLCCPSVHLSILPAELYCKIKRWETSSPVVIFICEGHHSRMGVSFCCWSIDMYVECLNRYPQPFNTHAWLNDWHIESPLHIAVHVFWHLCGFFVQLRAVFSFADGHCRRRPGLPKEGGMDPIRLLTIFL